MDRLTEIGNSLQSALFNNRHIAPTRREILDGIKFDLQVQGDEEIRGAILRLKDTAENAELATQRAESHISHAIRSVETADQRAADWKKDAQAAEALLAVFARPCTFCINWNPNAKSFCLICGGYRWVSNHGSSAIDPAA